MLKSSTHFALKFMHLADAFIHLALHWDAQYSIFVPYWPYSIVALAFWLILV